MNDLEELIRLSKLVARPYYIAVWVLSILLGIAVCGIVYISNRSPDITIDSEPTFIESDDNFNTISAGV